MDRSVNCCIDGFANKEVISNDSVGRFVCRNHYVDSFVLHSGLVL